VRPASGRTRPDGASRLRAWRDVLAASDPGLGRLLSALQLMLALGVTIGVVYVFMHTTEVLWVDAPGDAPPAVLAAADAQHRGITLLAMLLGGLIAMMSSMAVMDRQPREQALTMALMPIPMLATMALSVEMVAHRTAGIVLLALVIGLGTYVRKFVPRFGSRAFLYGAMLFIGYIFGFLSNGAVTEDQIGWIAVVLWLAVAVNLLLKVLVARPLDRGRLERTVRSFRARCRGVAAAAVALLDAATPQERERASRLLDRRLTRLNETALVIDGSIGAPDERPLGPAAFDAHDELFRLELVVQNLGRGVERFVATEPPPELREHVRTWIAELAAGRPAAAAAAARVFQEREAAGPSPLPRALSDDVGARMHHLARLVTAEARALETWPRHHAPADEAGGDAAPFQSAITLIFGDLPGSALVGAQAAASDDRRRHPVVRWSRLDPPAQAAIRVTLAVAAAAAVGSVLSERRFYWAVIAVFIAFMGANTSGEQVTKAVHRVAGTVLGILVGSLLAHLVGRSPWAIVVIIGALGFGIYFMKISYSLMVVGMTVMVSQLYEQLGEYSNHLLVLRLEETAIGAVIAVVAALVIFPVNTRRAATIAARGQLEALADLLGRLDDRIGDDPGVRLTSASRALDHAAHQLVATTRPLRLTPFRRDRLEHNAALFVQTAHQARNLVSSFDTGATGDERVAAEVRRALGTLRAAAASLAAAIEDERLVARPARIAGERLAGVDRALASEGAPSDDPGRVLLRRIDRLDETIAELAANLTSRRAAPAAPGPVAAAATAG
jgi:hypothetical protein